MPRQAIVIFMLLDFSVGHSKLPFVMFVCKISHFFLVGLLLRGPEDQLVTQGQNATFHCDTLSSDAYWRVTGDFNSSSDLFPPNNTHYLVSWDSMDDQYHNITLTVFTSLEVNSLRVTCHYYSSNINYASRTAQMFACSSKCIIIALR
jgi:hypothetical protein